MTKVLMIIYSMGIHMETPPVYETQIVSAMQCLATKSVVAELTHDTDMVIYIDIEGNPL